MFLSFNNFLVQFTIFFFLFEFILSLYHGSLMCFIEIFNLLHRFQMHNSLFHFSCLLGNFDFHTLNFSIDIVQIGKFCELFLIFSNELLFKLFIRLSLQQQLLFFICIFFHQWLLLFLKLSAPLHNQLFKRNNFSL